MVSPDLQRLRRIAADLLLGESTDGAEVSRGEFHDVVLLPGRAVVKVARGRAASYLRRRARLAQVLAAQDLPFAVSEPLTEVLPVDDGAAVALTWVPGAPAEARSGDSRRIRELLEALASVDVSASGPLAPWVDVPHAYAGRDRWAELVDDVISRLPEPVRAEGRSRVRAALELPACRRRWSTTTWPGTTSAGTTTVGWPRSSTGTWRAPGTPPSMSPAWPGSGGTPWRALSTPRPGTGPHVGGDLPAGAPRLCDRQRGER